MRYALILALLAGCATGQPPVEPCPATPLRHVNSTTRTWQDIIDARNLELVEMSRKECWTRY